MVVQINDVGMVANELRIGNWVELDGKYFKVFSSINHLGVDLDSEKLDKHMMFAGIDAIKPIRLTEEMLLKCGFEESIVVGWDYCIKISALYLRARKSCGNIYFELGDIYLGDTNLKHLHQLQNLYFALTGKELNVKL